MLQFNYLSTLGVGMTPSCRVSRLLVALFHILYRRRNSWCRDARRRFASVVYHGSRLSCLLHTESSFGIWTRGVATLDVGLLASCRTTSWGSSSFDWVSFVGVGKTGVASLVCLYRVLWRPEAPLHLNLYLMSASGRQASGCTVADWERRGRMKSRCSC
jgi:hypothetical protein